MGGGAVDAFLPQTIVPGSTTETWAWIRAGSRNILQKHEATNTATVLLVLCTPDTANRATGTKYVSFYSRDVTEDRTAKNLFLLKETCAVNWAAVSQHVGRSARSGTSVCFFHRRN